MQKQPLILVTNDDSIHAAGIHALVEVAMQFGKVLVIAPDAPQSGMGHAITIHDPLRLEPYNMLDGVEAYACSGTPVDSVKLAIYAQLKQKPDLILSGINHGANFSINVLYSGTMSAAIEGALEGVPSIGFSLLDYKANANFKPSQKIAERIIKSALDNKIPKDTCLNVNIPKLPYSKIKGIKICRQAKGHWQDDFQHRKDPTGKPYYWLSGAFQNMDKGEDTDTWALDHDYVSVVPTQIDLTAHHAIPEINNWDL